MTNSPPSFKLGGHRPPPPTLPTVYIMNCIAVLNCSIVDVPDLCPLTGEENHILLFKKMLAA